jgi:hypothetical protein
LPTTASLTVSVGDGVSSLHAVTSIAAASDAVNSMAGFLTVHLLPDRMLADASAGSKPVAFAGVYLNPTGERMMLRK